ncbi:DUF1080 domain-containing protein [Pollutibacter soli]|uniref:3-keto-disaccharide hydrolase n=1 Tax=Pollutibacter soli TaxID=3034157 RepID=UPI003013EF48
MKFWAASCLILIISLQQFHSDSASKSTPGEVQNTTDKNARQDWKPLFDGKSKNGWHVWLNKTDGSSWKVADGLLYLDTTGRAAGKMAGGDLLTDQDYENYHLSLEWKISKNGNSGIIFGIKEDAKYPWSFVTGLEMQILDNDGHSDGKIHKHRAGNLYDLVAIDTEPVKPVGEWNTAEVIWVKNKLELKLNGITVVSTTTNDDNWKKMVANSKFKNMPDFGRFTKGKIGLQDHGDLVWYRNIKIKQL